MDKDIIKWKTKYKCTYIRRGLSNLPVFNTQNLKENQNLKAVNLPVSPQCRQCIVNTVEFITTQWILLVKPLALIHVTKSL